MHGVDVPPQLEKFIDEEGRLTAWPSRKRRADQIAALRYLVQFFPKGQDMNEIEVNAILKARHTFGDWALLRREMFELGLIGRTPEVTRYWVIDQPAEEA